MAPTSFSIASFTCGRAGAFMGAIVVIALAAMPSVVTGTGVQQDSDAANGFVSLNLEKTLSRIKTPSFLPYSAVSVDPTVEGFTLTNGVKSGAATSLRGGGDEDRPALNAVPVTGDSGSNLVNLGNILSELLLEIPNLDNSVAGTSSMISTLTTSQNEGGLFIASKGAVPTKFLPQLGSFLDKILSSDEFPRLQNWIILFLYITSQILSPETGLPGEEDEIMRSTMIEIAKEGAAASSGATESQIEACANALFENGIRAIISIIKDGYDVLPSRRKLQTGDLIDQIDQFLVSLPRTIESALSAAEFSLFCIIYDSISFTLTAVFRITIRIINELIELFLGADDENFIIKSDDIDYFLSFGVRLRLCGFLIPPVDLVDTGLCLGLNLLPLVPILFRAYFAIFSSGFTTINSGVAVTSPNYLFGDQDSDTVKLGVYTRNLQESDGFYDLSCPDFERAFGEFQDGLQRLVSYEQVLVDKSFGSIRITSNADVNRNNKGYTTEKKSKSKSSKKKSCQSKSRKSSKSSSKASKSPSTGSNKSSKSPNMSSSKASKSPSFSSSKASKSPNESESKSSKKSSKSGKAGKSGKNNKCKKRECDAFVSAGVKNSLTCDAIEREDLNYLGSNCKIMTQIILDRFEEDEHIKNHLFDRYCEASNGFTYQNVNVPFMTRTEGCTRENMCTKAGRKICTIHDLPILKDVFMPNGILPKFIASRPNQDLSNLAGNTEDVTMIPTIYTLRHFGSNQLPALDLISMAISSHLVGEVNPGRQPEPTLPRILFELLGSLPGFDLDIILDGAGDVLFANGQDPLVYALIREFFLGEDASDICGPSFAVINRNSFRRFFSFEESELCNEPQATPVEDYASIFANIPLLADVGNKVTVVNPGTPYFERHPYNNDHDLLSLSLSVYFGNNVEIDCVNYSNIFDYIQDTIFSPLDIPRDEWYFPGSLSSSESPVLNGEAVSLTIEAQPGIVRDLLPFEVEQGINDFIPNTYGVLLSDSLEYVERYASADISYAPWLGQGTCFMSSAAWTELYSDHYINGGTSAVTPQGYQFRNGGDHEFSTIANNKRDFWSTLGEEFDADTSPGFLPNSVIFGEGCKAFGWGAYSSGYITVSDCPSSCDEGKRDVTASYISNQLDLFGLSFKSIYLLILANVIDLLFVNTGNPNDLFDNEPLDKVNISDPEESFKIGVFLFAALGESLFGSELPPVNDSVSEECDDINGAAEICDIICNICEGIVPNVCENSFVLDATPPPSLTVPDLAVLVAVVPGLSDLTNFIDDDQSINCNELSSWEQVCAAALVGGSNTCYAQLP